MSSQRGNVKRTRSQKYKNKSVFRNDLHDTSRRTKDINNLEVAEVCKQCKDVIEWKIKYKKYKPLSQPKTCVQCHQKSIKHAYHTVCDPCGKALGVCCKCRQLKVVIRRSVQMKPKEDIIAMMRKDLKLLPERKRRAFYRYLDNLYGTKKNKKNKKKSEGNAEDSEDKEEERNESQREESEEVSEITEDYLEKIREKLEELSKGLSSDKFDFEEFEDSSDDDSEFDDRTKSYENIK